MHWVWILSGVTASLIIVYLLTRYMRSCKPSCHRRKYESGVQNCDWKYLSNVQVDSKDAGNVAYNKATLSNKVKKNAFKQSELLPNHVETNDLADLDAAYTRGYRYSPSNHHAMLIVQQKTLVANNVTQYELRLLMRKPSTETEFKVCNSPIVMDSQNAVLAVNYSDACVSACGKVIALLGFSAAAQRYVVAYSANSGSTWKYVFTAGAADVIESIRCTYNGSQIHMSGRNGASALYFTITNDALVTTTLAIAVPPAQTIQTRGNVVLVDKVGNKVVVLGMMTYTDTQNVVQTKFVKWTYLKSTQAWTDSLITMTPAPTVSSFITFRIQASMDLHLKYGFILAGAAQLFHTKDGASTFTEVPVAFQLANTTRALEGISYCSCGHKVAFGCSYEETSVPKDAVVVYCAKSEKFTTTVSQYTDAEFTTLVGSAAASVF